MVSSELYLPEEDDDSASTMKEMIGGCCVCSDERGWAENPLVYCDGHGCNVAVHQGKYKDNSIHVPGVDVCFYFLYGRHVRGGCFDKFPAVEGRGLA